MKILNKNQLKSILKINKGKSYTYGLCKPDGTIFYVGVGSHDRVLKHGIPSDVEKCANKAKINYIMKYGLQYCLFRFGDRESCSKLENDIVVKLGRIDNNSGILTNLTDGGEGCRNIGVSEETKIIKSKKAFANRDLFVKIAKEQWESKSKESIESYKKQAGNRLKSLWETEEYREVFIDSIKSRWADPVFKEKMRKKISESQDPEVNRRIMKQKWADPEIRKVMLEKRRLTRLKNKGLSDPSISDILQNETLN